MLGQARRRYPEAQKLTCLQGDLLDHAVPIHSSGYDAITAVSSLHHMPLQPAIQRLAELLRPGGVLIVVGHYRLATAGDRALELVRLPANAANAAVGAAGALRGRPGKPDDNGMPMLPPSSTFADVQVPPIAPPRRDFAARSVLALSPDLATPIKIPDSDPLVGRPLGSGA